MLIKISKTIPGVKNDSLVMYTPGGLDSLVMDTPGSLYSPVVNIMDSLDSPVMNTWENPHLDVFGTSIRTGLQ